MKNLTTLETQVIEKIKTADEFEGMPTACIEDLCDWTGLSINVLKGVLSSLLQKNILSLGEYPNGMTAFHYEG